MLKFTKKENELIMQGLLCMIENNEKAMKLVSAPKIVTELRKENGEILTLLNKIVSGGGENDK